MHQQRPESLVLGEVLSDRAGTHGDAPFLRFRDGIVTYGEVDARANQLAQGLLAHHLGKGDHVAVMLPNCADIVYAVFALARLGVVAVPVNTQYRGAVLRHVLASSDARMLIIDSGYCDRLAELVGQLPRLERVVVRGDGPAAFGDVPVQPLAELLRHEARRPDVDVAFSDTHAIMYTSGTTGPSKGAMCSHALALTCAYDSLTYLDRWGKTVYCPLPLFHAAALWDGVFSALLSGASIAIVEKFSASRFWDDVRYFDARVALSVFSMIPILLSQPPTPRDLDHPLEMFYMGKSALDEPLRTRFGVRSVETYTSTEAGIGTGSPYGQWRVGSCGTVNADRFDAAIVDEHDREVPDGEPGELVLRPKQPYVVTTGYYGAPELTAETFRNMWFHTGDRMWRDADGYFYFLDRMKDSIRRRGENISAFDLECEINTHPAVLECAAIGVPSELEDEDVKIAVVLHDDATLTPTELIEFCRQRLPSFMVPRYVEFLDALPRTPTDKVAKYRLRAAGDHGITAGTWDREGAA